MVARNAVKPLLALGAVLVVAGCGDDGDAGGGVVGTVEDPVTEFTIVAEDIEFDLSRVVVPVGEEVTATIDNRDEGIGHNLRVELDGDDALTEVESGPIEQTLTFTVDRAGDVEFRCDPHIQMRGTIQAVGG